MDPELLGTFSMDVFDACVENLDDPVLEIAAEIPFRTANDSDEK